MNLDTASDQEQIEIIKKWWKENGTSIILGLVLGGGAIFGWRFWNSHQIEQNVKNSDSYETLSRLDDSAYIVDAEKFIKDNNGVYATNAALTAAAKAINNGNNKTAHSMLRWTIDNADNEAHRLIARLNLARLAVSENKHDDAVKLLENVDAKNFKVSYLLTLADAYVIQNKHEKARELLNKAKNAAFGRPEMVVFIQMKIDNLAT